MKMNYKNIWLVILSSLLLLPAVIHASCISTDDYDQQGNPVTLMTYGYTDPIDGFVGATLEQPFMSDHYSAGYSHLGADFMVPAYTTNVYSICDGTVIENQDMTYQKDVRLRNNYNAYFNSRIIVQCDSPSFLVIYGHVDNNEIPATNRVTKGMKIAEIAPAYNSSNIRVSSWDHLHFGTNVQNSITYIPGVWGWGIGPGTATISEVESKGFRDPFIYICQNPATQPEGVSVEYFWRRDDPIIASNQSGEDNFDAQFGIKNNSSSSVTVEDMAIAILQDGALLFDCWRKNSSTTISAGDSYPTGIQYCEIYNSGSYSVEARLKIDGNWETRGSHSFTVLDQPSGITVYDFWRKADPIYASNQSGVDNFDAQFRVQNNESSSVTINNMAIAVLKDGAFLFDCWLKDSPTTIPGNSSYSTDIKYCEIWNSGSYSVEARLQMGEDWGTYGSHSFTVHDQQTSFPDLVVESPSVDDNTLTPNEDFKIFATVRNAGNGSSAATTLRYYLSSNSTISTSDSEIGTDSVDALSAGASSPEDKSGREAPSSPGSYWVGACVDAVSGESNTGNNCSSGVQITVADDPPGSQEPVGYFDSADCNGFSGWTKDPDTTAAIDVHFYADGPAGAEAFIGGASANIYRGDLPYSDKNHGFSFPTPESLKDGQSHQIYVYALDDQGGINPLLTNSPKSIQCTPVNQTPVGYFEGASCSALSGWAKDPDTTDPISVHFYADGPAGTGIFVGTALADVYRDDLPYDDKNHGFSFTFPDSLNDGLEHQVYAYALDSGGGDNPLLTNSPKTVQCGLTADQLVAVISVIENVILADDEEGSNTGWLPAIFKLLLLD